MSTNKCANARPLDDWIFTLPKYDFTFCLYRYQRTIPFIKIPTIYAITLEISPAVPSNTIMITPIIMPIIESITALVLAHPLPFRRPHETTILAIASAIRMIPSMWNYPDISLN